MARGTGRRALPEFGCREGCDDDSRFYYLPEAADDWDAALAQRLRLIRWWAISAAVVSALTLTQGLK